MNYDSDCAMGGKSEVLSLARDGPVDWPFEPLPKGALDGSIIDRFDAIAARYPDRLAVRDQTHALTYRALSALVTRIAAELARVIGDRPGPVAILLRNEARYPAAMLGVLASGRAFVPLDSDHPIERNRLIAAEAGAAAIISAAELASVFGALFSQHQPIVDVDAIGDAVTAQPAVSPASDDHAFIAYTSGSTGRPKGAYHSHRNLLHDIWQQTNTLHVNADDRVALVYSPVVIAGIREIMLALLNGAALHILPPNQLRPSGLVQEIEAHGITIFRTVPVLLRRIAQVLGPERRLGGVRVVGLGSQRVDWSDYDLFRRHFAAEAFLIVGIGATECGGNYAHWFVDDRIRASGGSLPIGRVLPDARVSIETDDGRPVGAGEVGEFIVASRYLGLGYWRDPALTAQAFAVDPTDPTRRLFRTGDMGRLRPDGLLEYVGRKDQQIKLDGRRVELGEVERALVSCRGIRDAAVVERRDETGIPRVLAAYCELEPAVTGVSPRQLSATLAETLPDFMLPRAITFLDALPRLPNMKIDREELRRRDKAERARSLTASASTTVEQSDQIQQTLLELWRAVLKRDDIGPDDDFFLLGGDSLAAVDLLHRIEKELQYQLPLSILTQAPSVRQFETLLTTTTLGATGNTIRIHTAGRRRPLFAVGGLDGHAIRLLPLLGSLGPDQPCYGLQPPAMDWSSAGCATLPQIAAHYIREIKAVQRHGPYRLLGGSLGGLVAFEMALQLQRSGESIEHLAMIDTAPPTCLIEGTAEIWRTRYIAGPQPTDPIGALNLRVVETHLRVTREYILDSRLDDHIFHGELTYFYCTGNPIVAERDRRGFWFRFADQIRLLQVPGSHGEFHRNPQCRVLQNLLRACLDGEPPPGNDPAEVYDRAYRFDRRGQRETIVSSAGETYRVTQDRVQGHVDEVRIDAEAVRVVGWAVEPCRRQPAQNIAVFVEDKFLGYGASDDFRPDLAQHLAAAQYAGFDFDFRPSSPVGALGRPRLFVLSSDGCAAELGDSIKPPTVGSVVKLSSTMSGTVILSGDWYAREPFGVWSNGCRAALIFDASAMPDRFLVAIRAHLFPQNPTPIQRVRISDDSGSLLATITNERPNGDVVVKMERSRCHSANWLSLIFDIEHPISHRDLDMSEDIRKLGIGVVSLTFHE